MTRDSDPCPACGGALSLVCDAERMRSLADHATRFHSARLRSRQPAELDERASFTHDAAATLLGCDRCSLLVRSPRPSADASLHTYAEDRYPADRIAEMIASQISLYRRKLPLLRRLTGVRTPRVVEVGSFVGGFLEVARTAGWSAVGVDPNPQLADSCRSRGLRVQEGTLEECQGREASASVDAVAIWNTFDQLPDPRPVLASAARLLRPGGVLALRVPHGAAFRVLHALRKRARGPGHRFLEACLAWNNLLSFPYLYGYGLASLEKIVPPHGFHRTVARGDVLGMLAGRATRGFARTEERAVKQLQLTWIAMQSRDAASPLPAAPWLDVYYRRTGDLQSRPG